MVCKLLVFFLVFSGLMLKGMDEYSLFRDEVRKGAKPEAIITFLRYHQFFYDVDGNNPLLHICKWYRGEKNFFTEFYPFFMTMIEEVNYRGETAFIIAAKNGDSECLQRLFEEIGDYYKRLRPMEEISLPQRRTLLMYNTIKYLLIKQDTKKRTALHYAVMAHNLNMCALLLNHAPFSELNTRDNDGLTPFNYAVSEGCSEIVTYFNTKNVSPVFER